MTRPVVLVAGPSAAGATSLVAVLTDRLPDVDVVETCDGDPVVVVLVVSAVAPPVPSDLAVLDAAAARADAVLGAVTKIDAHRRWRDVLAGLSASARYRDIRWTGTAAAPQLGPPQVDALVGAVIAALRAAPDRRTARARHLRACRAALVRDHRHALADPTAGLRTGLHRERLDGHRFTRDRCARLRAEFRAVAAELPRRSIPALEHRLRTAADALSRDVDRRVERGVADLAVRFGTDPPGASPSAQPHWDAAPTVSRRAERALTVALGAGFGLGIAVAVGRVLAALAPWAAMAAQAAGALVGLLFTAWLVSTRELLHDRAMADRRVCDVIAQLRGHLEDRVTDRLLDAEAHLGAALTARAAQQSEDVGRRLAVIDDELRVLRSERVHPRV